MKAISLWSVRRAIMMYKEALFPWNSTLASIHMYLLYSAYYLRGSLPNKI